jgi:hypothetical protein
MHSIDPQTDEQVADLESTARINRRSSVLARIEAALLAGTLGVEDNAGSDPYNQGKVRADAWGKGRAR